MGEKILMESSLRPPSRAIVVRSKAYPVAFLLMVLATVLYKMETVLSRCWESNMVWGSEKLEGRIGVLVELLAKNFWRER